MPRPRQSTREARAAGTLTPIVVVLLFGFSVYAVLVHVVGQQLVRSMNRLAVAVPLVVVNCLAFTLMLWCYGRLVWVVRRRPDIVAPTVVRGDSQDDHNHNGDQRQPSKPIDPTDPTDPDPTQPRQAYTRSASSQPPSHRHKIKHHFRLPKGKTPLGNDRKDEPFHLPDLHDPSLQRIAHMDAYQCDADGLPRWCDACGQWKPDRAHHSRDLQACIYRMDHFCPWVGGMVGERAYRLFVQFCGYCGLWCSTAAALSVYCLVLQLREVGEPSHDDVADDAAGTLDGVVLAAAGLTGLFTLFSVGMFGVAVRYVLTNQTSIEKLQQPAEWFIAVRLPPSCVQQYPYTKITYPPAPPPPPPPPGHDTIHTSSPAVVRDPHPPQHTPGNSFAVLRLDGAENPWDLGWRANWTAIMGRRWVDMLLPLGEAPLTRARLRHQDRYWYPYGPAVCRLQTDIAEGRVTSTHEPAHR